MSVTAIQKPFVKLGNPAFDTDDNVVVVSAQPVFGAWSDPFGDFGFDTLLFGLSHAKSASKGGGTSGGTGSTSGTTGKTGSGATPSWISTLNDSVIKADMTAASAGGTVSETGMAQLFTDLAAELTTDKATLSASQLSDLQTIATNLNVGETASPYVTYITDALIDGNAANAKWTGGAASATTLGNLAVGATATQITELDGKWFLGTDLPSSTVKMTGVPTFSVSYSAVTSPVFGAGGPSMNDINQGYLGDCSLLASLAEIANRDPSAIVSMITNNGNNTYGVRFYVDGNAEYVTVNDELPDGGTEFNSATNIWASLVEKAYAQIQASGVITGNSVNDGNSFSTIGNGIDPEYTLEEITDAPTITDFDAGHSSWSEYVYNDALVTQSSNSGLSTASVLSTLVGDLGQGYGEVLSSNTDATASNGMTTLVADHTLSIYGYDSTTGDLEIRNPWGTTSGQSWDTTFEVSLTTLLADGDTVSVADISSSPSSVVTGALVSAAAGLQANAAVTAFSIADTMADVSAAFASLATDTKLTSIILTNSSTPSLALTAAQYTADAVVLALIVSPYNLTVTGATGTIGAVIISGAVANQTTSGATSLSPMSTVVISDPNAGQTETLTVTPSPEASGTLSNLGVGGYNATTGVYTVTGSASVVTSAVDGLVFTPTLDQAPAGQTVTTTFTISDTDTAGATATNSTTSVVATATPITATQVAAAYQAILRTQPGTDLVNQTVAQIDAGQTTLAQYESGLIASDQALYTTLPVLVTIDAFYGATPQSSTLTAVAADTGSPAQVGGFYSAPYLHSLGFSDPNVWTVMASQWGADPTSPFYAMYSSYGSNYSSFIAAVYQREFGFAPSATNLQNLVNDVPGVENLLAGPAGAATPIQVVSGIYGYLLYVGQTTPSLTTQYAASADAFLQAAANGTVTYGPELTQEFPSGTAADPGVMTITSSDQLIDPGAGSYTMQFLAGTSGDTLMLHADGVDQVSGFNPGTDVLDFSSVLSEAGINLNGGLAALGNYVTIVDQGTNALVNFNPTGHGGGSTVAVLQGQGSTVTSLGALVADNAIRIA